MFKRLDFGLRKQLTKGLKMLNRYYLNAINAVCIKELNVNKILQL